MPFDDGDLDTFFDADMPGYAQASVEGVLVAGLFRSPYAESFGLVGSNSARFHGRTSDLINVLPGDRMDIEATTYTVAAVKPNGFGMTTVELK